MYRSLAIPAALFVLTVPALVLGETPTTRGLAVVPDEVQQSRIVEVVGSVPVRPELRGQRTPAQLDQLRQAALAVAVQTALVKVGDDIVATGARLKRPDNPGAVTVLETRDLEAESDRFAVFARAEVRVADLPAQSSPAATDTATPDDPKAPLSLRIWTDKKVVTEGDSVQVYVHANKDFYGRITYEQADGTIIQVLPNGFRAEARFAGGKDYRIPDQGDRFKLRVTAPFGLERFSVYGSTAPLGPVPGKTNPGTGLVVAAVPRTDVGRATRGLAVVADEPDTASVADQRVATAPVSEFYEATWTMTTQAAGAAGTVASGTTKTIPPAANPVADENSNTSNRLSSSNHEKPGADPEISNSNEISVDPSWVFHAAKNEFTDRVSVVAVSHLSSDSDATIVISCVTGIKALLKNVLTKEFLKEETESANKFVAMRYAIGGGDAAISFSSIFNHKSFFIFDDVWNSILSSPTKNLRIGLISSNKVYRFDLSGLNESMRGLMAQCQKYGINVQN